LLGQILNTVRRRLATSAAVRHAGLPDLGADLGAGQHRGVGLAALETWLGSGLYAIAGARDLILGDALVIAIAIARVIGVVLVGRLVGVGRVLIGYGFLASERQNKQRQEAQATHVLSMRALGRLSK
jgi:hypothetical protein